MTPSSTTTHHKTLNHPSNSHTSYPYSTPKPLSQFQQVLKWLKSHQKTVSTHTIIKKGASSFLKSTLPIIDWLPRYNAQWLVGDLIAGFTVGLVVIPQVSSSHFIVWEVHH
jgi:hypothetical protein